MKVYGERTVYYELVPGGFGHVNYIVADVTMPILSVTTMLTNGWSAELSATTNTLVKDHIRCSLQRVKQLLFVCPLRRMPPRPQQVQF